MLYKKITRNRPFFIAGPCVIESEMITLQIAEAVKKISESYENLFIFKASFDKANRNSIESYRGPGIKDGLKLLEKIKKEFEIPVLTDIHETWQAEEAGEIVDILQIPAFLCRQTDLLLSAAKTGKIVNIKKGQFVSGNSMKNIVDKIRKINSQILLTERGSFFGYGDLIVDYRNIVNMKKIGFPVVFDGTHSVQKPAALGKASGGDREFVPYLSAAAAAVGCDGFFFEIHPEPEKALSDGPNMIPLSEFPMLVDKLLKISKLKIF